MESLGGNWAGPSGPPVTRIEADPYTERSKWAEQD